MIKNLIVLLVGIVVCLPAVWPFLQPNFFHMHDWTHVARLAEMDQALQDGHFPVRWSKDLGYGYGMPQFNFYAPLFYYGAEIFHLAGISFLWSIKLMVIANYLGSFIAMYYLASSLWGKYAGLLAGTTFIYIPYRAVDTYVRGAFGELTAITFIALSVWGIVMWIKNPSGKRMVLASLGVGGLILAHNLVAFLSLPLLLALTLILTLVYQKKVIPGIISGLIFVLGIGLSAFYSLPAIMEKGETQVDALTTGF
jgi:4-amino-4-deoxy-L-arabinose transferase-like glycosyltransferase